MTMMASFTRNIYKRALIALLLIATGYAVLFGYFVNSYVQHVDDLRREALKDIVQVALNTINPIRDQQRRGELTKDQALVLGINLIRRMTYTYGSTQNNVFMLSYDGATLSQSLEQGQQGANQWDLKDASGKYIVRSLAEIARSNEGQGYFEYLSAQPGSTTPQTKGAYVVGIPEWEVYIGTSMVLKDNTLDTEGYIARSLLLSSGFVLLILAVVYFALRPTLRSYAALRNLFEQVKSQPDSVPSIPNQQFQTGSDGWHLLNGFQSMLAEVQQSKHRLREREEMLEQRIKDRTHELATLAQENVRLYEEERASRHESEQRRWIAESLRDVLKTLNSNSPLEDSLNKIVTQAARLLDTNAAAIFRLQAGTDILTVQTSYGLPEQYIKEMSVPVGQSVLGRAVKERRVDYVPDRLIIIPNFNQVSEHTPPTLTLEVMQRFRAVLATPLIIRDEVYGGIVLYYEEPRNFSEEQLELITIFADQAALAVENARLRAQAEQDAAAAERQRLARELHDAVTQTLFSASLIAEVLPRIIERNPDEARQKLEELRMLARGALAEMRTLLLELRPSVLTQVKLGELLQQLGEAISGRARIGVSVTIESDCVLPAEVQIAIYRITQESLNNVVKHANATRITVHLRCQPDRVHLTVQDNGQGFDLNTVTAEHLGLKIMRERADSVGAQLGIRSQPQTPNTPEGDHGTMLTLLWEQNTNNV